MKISYKKLWIMLVEREISKQTLRAQCGMAANTMTRLNKGEKVTLDVLMKICAYLKCNIGDICEFVFCESAAERNEEK